MTTTETPTKTAEATLTVTADGDTKTFTASATTDGSPHRTARPGVADRPGSGGGAVTAVPRELARRQPANTPVRRDDGRTIDGQFRAVRGGPSLAAVINALILLILAALFTGYLLSTL